MLTDARIAARVAADSLTALHGATDAPPPAATPHPLDVTDGNPRLIVVEYTDGDGRLCLLTEDLNTGEQGALRAHALAVNAVAATLRTLLHAPPDA